MRIAPGVQEEPLTLRASWSAREYATRRPTPATFQNWTLSFEVTSQTTEVLVVRMIRLPIVLRFGRTHRSGAGTAHVASLAIRWHDYGSSDAITIGFTGGNDLAVEDRQFGLDPQRWVEVVAPEVATTGAVVPLAKVPRLHDLTVEIVCLAKADTVNTHGRWAIKQSLRAKLMPEYDFLASGAVSGERSLPAGRS